MQSVDVLCHFSFAYSFFQIKIYAESLGDKLDVGVDVDWSDPLLYVGRLKIKNESHFQNLFIIDHKSVHHLL